MSKPILTQDYLKKILKYKDGKLYWKIDRGNNSCKNKQTGLLSKNDGYGRISLYGKSYLAHRIIWLYHYGYMPKFIDHLDHNRSNNSIDNLADKTHQENHRNRKLHKNNSSGFTGVTYHKTKKLWTAQITLGMKQVQLGQFDTLEEAIGMRLTANDHYDFHITHGT